MKTTILIRRYCISPAPVFALAGFVFVQAQVLDFDPTSEGPWSDKANTTLTVPQVPNGSVVVDGQVSEREYGGFAGVTVTPGVNAWILDYPGDRSWDGPEDTSFTFWLAHDESYLYVGVEVQDDVVTSDDPNAAFWKDDSIEIVVDALNDRYNNNTDNSADPYGGHCYVNYEGRFSGWDDVGGVKASTSWSTALEWTYGEEGDIYGAGGETETGWRMEVRFNKRLFEDPEAGNRLQDGYVMGFNIGLDDDDQRGPGATGSGARSQDLELQYFWANRKRILEWTKQEAEEWWTPEQIEAGEHWEYWLVHGTLAIDPAGRLSHGGTGEIVFGALTVIPSLSIEKSGADIQFSWTGGGTLQEADQVGGPWADAANQVTPQTRTASSSAKFFRIR